MLRFKSVICYNKYSGHSLHKYVFGSYTTDGNQHICQYLHLVCHRQSWSDLFIWGKWQPHLE